MSALCCVQRDQELAKVQVEKKKTLDKAVKKKEKELVADGKLPYHLKQCMLQNLYNLFKLYNEDFFFEVRKQGVGGGMGADYT